MLDSSAYEGEASPLEHYQMYMCKLPLPKVSFKLSEPPVINGSTI
jgi:hypothetical protein